MREPIRFPSATHRAVAALLVLSLTACAAEVEPKMPPENPAPTQLYVAEFWVEDPPRPMRLAHATARFGVTDEACLPKVPISGVNAISGAHELPARVEPLANGRHRVSAYRDALMPQDSYGKGECSWTLHGFDAYWSDGMVLYRAMANVVEVAAGSMPHDRYVVYPREPRGWPEPGLDLPLAHPLQSGEFTGAFPTGFVDDTSSRYFRPRRADERVPARALSPELDFLLRSLSPASEREADVVDTRTP